MSSHIEISSTASRLSADVRRAIDDLQRVQDEFAEIKNVADQVALGADWASLATKLGTSQADAETAYNLVTAAQTALEAAALTAVTSRLG